MYVICYVDIFLFYRMFYRSLLLLFEVCPIKQSYRGKKKKKEMLGDE